MDINGATKRFIRGWIVAITAISVAGCSSDSLPNKEEAKAETGGSNGQEARAGEPIVKEPVTLKLYSHYAAINNDQDVQSVFGTVLAKHPNITIELVKGVNIADLIAAKEIPDLIAVPNGSMYDMLNLGLASDLNDDFVKKYGVDFNRFEPEAVKALRSYGKKGEVYGIPYTLNYGALIYNKDIFDTFAVPYPKDGMTWEEITDLAAKVTRVDSGTSFIGLDPGAIKSFSRSYMLPTVNQTEDRAVLDSEGYKRLFSLLKDMYDIPGVVDPKNKYSYGIDWFLKEQKLAMHSAWLAAITSRLPPFEQSGNTFSWDLAGHPVFSDRPGIGKEIEFQSLLVPAASKHKEAAYRVLLTLIGDEAQSVMNKGNNLTILNKPELRVEFASNTNIYKGKNLEGVFKIKPAPAPMYSEYDAENYKYLGDAQKSMIVDKEDINTVLRTANERANKYMETVKSQK
ncbi:ABC transporter substrate-binding protein [Paenibacillus sp. GYB003]|uniref:ABC transporter substrate-binding protein n=1 Tax=Paenibacillus sp. GYB003 TaxID=2994392 RepID=UPI002F963B83